MTRCPECGARMRSGGCPACGDDRSGALTIVDLDAETRDRAPLDRRAYEERFADLGAGLGTVPRRVHDPYAWRTPAVLATVIAGLLVVTALASGPSTPPGTSELPVVPATLDARTGASLAVVGSSAVTVLDVDTRKTETIAAPGPVTDAIALRSSVVVLVAGVARAIAPDGSEVARPLGRADAVLGSPTTVWLVSGSRATPITADARPLGAGVTLPGDAAALAAIDRGLLTGSERKLTLYDENGRSRDVATAVSLVAAGGDEVVTRARGCSSCPLMVLDLRHATRRTLGVPRPEDALVAATLSPDGRSLAVFSTPRGSPSVRVTMVDVPSGRGATAITGTEAPGRSGVAWSHGRLFAVIGGAVLSIDRDAHVRRLDVVLPPFDQLLGL